MSLTSADYDGDGDFDLFATGLGASYQATYGLLSEQVLFENQGDGTYSDETYAAGLGGFEWGWGASFVDYDNDGDEDLFQVGSFPTAFGIVGPNLASPGRLFENDGNSNFQTTQTFGLDGLYTSGLAIGDYDNDGFQDALITTGEFVVGPYSGDGAPVLLHNDGNNNHWIKIRLVGTTSNRNGIGAIVQTKLRDTVQVKQVHAGTSFSSSNSPWLSFGLGARDNVDVKVTWPSGLVEEFDALDGDQLVTLVEGTGK